MNTNSIHTGQHSLFMVTSKIFRGIISARKTDDGLNCAVQVVTLVLHMRLREKHPALFQQYLWLCFARRFGSKDWWGWIGVGLRDPFS